MNRKKGMSAKEMWNYIIFQAKGYAVIPYIIVFGTVSAAASTYVNSYLYAKILNNLLDFSYDAAVRHVLFLVLAVMMLELVAKACDRMFEHYITPSEEETRKQTAKKAFSMEYEEIEKAETLQKFRRVRQGEIGHGGITSQLRYMYQYFTELARVVFACGFVAVLLFTSDLHREGILRFVLSTAALFAAFAGILWLGRKISKDIGQIEYRMNLENEKSNSIFFYLSNIVCSEKWGPDIRIFGMQDYLLRKFDTMLEIGERFLKMGFKVGEKSGILAFAMQLFAGSIYVYIVLKADAGSISVGEVLMYAGAIITMADSIRNLMAIKIEIDYSNEYLKTYEEFINLPNMHYDGTLPVEKRLDNRYELCFSHVSFKYPGTKQYVIRNLNLKFNIGEKLALVGQNGAGKTTLIKLLLRLYEPTEGQILLNGIDIGKYDYEEYTRIFSVVFQDFELYHLPLDENIAGSENVDEERVKDVLDQVGLSGRVEKMHDGIHTLLYHETGDGEALSGGEAQKVAIARAIYKDAPFVILDEPTSALDPIAEAEIYENFNDLVGDKTAIYISHRMSSCKFCDKIVVLDGGKIVESGNHEQLLEKQGLYASLYQAQAQHYA